METDRWMSRHAYKAHMKVMQTPSWPNADTSTIHTP